MSRQILFNFYPQNFIDQFCMIYNNSYSYSTILIQGMLILGLFLFYFAFPFYGILLRR